MSRPLVLCATDLTDEGTRAVDLALATARAVGGELVLLHTCDPIPEGDDIPASVAPAVGGLRERLVERKAEAEKKMGAERARAVEAGVDTTTLLVDGPPSDAILDVARARHAALVVLGRRHREEGFMGKTVDRVVRHAPCPVFVAPPEAAAPRTLENAKWVVGVDFSIECLHAIHAAAAFVKRCGGEMQLVHIVQPAGGEGRAYEERSPAELLREEGLREEETRLRELAARAAPGAKVAQVRTIERPSSDLCRIAEEVDATAVVVGTHGRSGVARFFLGSTAERLLRRAKLPVLVVREAPEEASSWYDSPASLASSHAGPTRILAAVDFSDPARRALELARTIGAKLRIPVEVVHVFDVPADVRKGLASALSPDETDASVAQERALGRLREALEALVGDVFGPDASTIRTHVVSGRPVGAILELSRKREADLVVVGTTGRTGIERLLLGSVAERLVRESTVPVLTAH